MKENKKTKLVKAYFTEKDYERLNYLCSKDPHPLGQEVDTIHKKKGILKKPSLGMRLKASRCEWCGKQTAELVMHQVRTLKALDESQPWAAFMKSINRKTLVVCENCHKIIHGADCE